MGIDIEQFEKAVHNNSTRDIEDREIIVGLTRKGEPFPTLLSSWLLGGQTQQGKSVIAAWFVMWFVVAGAQIVLLDPHLHNKKRGLFTKIEPLQEWFALPAIDCLDIDELLSYIDWLEDEYKKRKHSMDGKKPLLLVIDEFNEFLSSGLTKKQVERVATVIGNLARGGAKHGIFVLAIGHNFDLASAGGNAVRRNIIGRVSVSAEIGEMCNILDTTDRTRLKQIANNPPLRPGHAIVKVPGYGLYRLHYPYITPEYLSAFATFMQKNAQIPAISDHSYFLTLPSELQPVERPVPIYAPPIHIGINAINPSKIPLSVEERTAIETAAKIQLQETGGVNRTKLRKDLGWQNKYRAYEKIKQVADKHGWPFASKQDKLKPEEWEAIKEKYHHRCVKCGCYSEDLEPDRIVPGVKGGSYEPSNVQPLCKSCNSGKREKIIDFRPRKEQSV